MSHVVELNPQVANFLAVTSSVSLEQSRRIPWVILYEHGRTFHEPFSGNKTRMSHAFFATS